MPTKKPATASKKMKIPYDTSSVHAMNEKWREGIQKRTGKSFEQWRKLMLKACGPEIAEREAWLKNQGLNTMCAGWIARDKYAEIGEYDPEALVDAQYQGKKAELKPLYDELLRLGIALGSDVTVRPCETTVPLFRKFAFAYIAAATNTCVDLALALGDRLSSGRVERLATASSNRVSHRIRISSLKEIDAEVKKLMAEAYSHGDEALERHAAVGAGGEAKLPAEFAAALKAHRTAKATFDDACTPKMRADFVAYVSEPKKPETRTKRIEMAIAQLEAGKKRMYC